MANTLRLLAEAHDEYIEAYEWYELRQKGLGEKYMNAVEKCLSQIQQHPTYCGKKAHHYRKLKVPNFPYMVVYQFFKRKQLIYVTAIYHAKRNPKGKYRRIK